MKNFVLFSQTSDQGVEQSSRMATLVFSNEVYLLQFNSCIDSIHAQDSMLTVWRAQMNVCAYVNNSYQKYIQIIWRIVNPIWRLVKWIVSFAEISSELGGLSVLLPTFIVISPSLRASHRTVSNILKNNQAKFKIFDLGVFEWSFPSSFNYFIRSIQDRDSMLTYVDAYERLIVGVQSASKVYSNYLLV
jgi:hypothetical protein